MKTRSCSRRESTLDETREDVDTASTLSKSKATVNMKTRSCSRRESALDGTMEVAEADAIKKLARSKATSEENMLSYSKVVHDAGLERFAAAYRELEHAEATKMPAEKVVEKALADIERLVCGEKPTKRKRENAGASDEGVERKLLILPGGAASKSSEKEVEYYFSALQTESVLGIAKGRHDAEPLQAATTTASASTPVGTRKSTRLTTAAGSAAKRTSAPKPMRKPSMPYFKYNPEFDVDPPRVIDPLEGVPRFKLVDRNGTPVKKENTRCKLVDGHWVDAMIVKLPFTAWDKIPGFSKKTQVKEATKVKDRPAPQAEKVLKFETLFHRITPPETPGQASSNSSPDMAGAEQDWESASEADDTNNTTPTAHQAPIYPPFPSLRAAAVLPFIKGVAIAIENITEDHEAAKAPKPTLLEVVRELEDNKPTVPTIGDSHIVLKGNEYVYAAVRPLFFNGADQASEIDGPAKRKIPSDKADASSKRKIKVPVALSKLVQQKASRRTAFEADKEAFKAFVEHARKECEALAKKFGVQVDEDLMPAWVWKH